MPNPTAYLAISLCSFWVVGCNSFIQSNHHADLIKRPNQVIPSLHRLLLQDDDETRTLRRGRSRTTTMRSSTTVPWIDANDAWGNWAIMTGAAWSAQILGNTTTIGRLLGPPVTAMTITFGLASLGILPPGSTDATRNLQLLSLQMATPLVLLGADLRDALQQCGPMFVSFALASLGTIVGCIIGYKYIAGNWLQRALGKHDGLVIAAALLAKNVGGGINYMAVCQSFQASPMAVAAGLCVDNLFALVYFPLTSLLANGLSDVAVPQPLSSNHSTRAADDCIDDSSNTITVKSISNVLFTAAALVWAGQKLGGTGAALPACSLLTVVVASVAPRKIINANRTTAELLGSVALYLFFATAGAPGLAVADSVRSSILPLSAFLFSLYSIHGVLLWIGYYLFGQKFPSMYPQRLLVASSAAIGGPATATALANSAGWKSLCVPSVLVGNIGYAIATFCGILFVRLFA